MRITTGTWAALAAILLTAVPLHAAAASDSAPTFAGSSSAAPGPTGSLAPAASQDAEHRSARAVEALEAAQQLFETRDGAAREPSDGAPGSGPSVGAQGLDPSFDARGRRTTPGPADEHGADAHSTDGHDHVIDGTDQHASLVLRDLALGLDELEGSDRALAQRILARPTDGRRDAFAPAKYGTAPRTNTCRLPGGAELRLCVHWVTDETNDHAPPQADEDGDGVPDWVQENQQVFEEVWQRIVVELGYRAPRSDAAVAGNHGPDGRTDIYLADLTPYAMYGYCTMDEPKHRAAYCVVDNDFEGFLAPAEESLRVTAAHEFFHAVQFSYSLKADLWLMEGTAAWVEDEVYDHINDNLQFLNRSALRFPRAPLDFIDPQDFNWVYGSWIWWRFLAEYSGGNGAPDPSVVRHLWQRLATDGPAEGSYKAMRTVLRMRGHKFGDVFADFGAVNRIAPRWYDEGRSYSRYVGPPGGRFQLTKHRPGTGWRVAKIDHLSSEYAVLRPSQELRGPWRVRIDLDLPPRFRGSSAHVLVHRTDGGVGWREVRLSKQGDGRVVVPFSARKVSRVTVALTNASTRMSKCNSGTLWSCGGVPRDDGLPFAFRARAVWAAAR